VNGCMLLADLLETLSIMSFSHSDITVKCRNFSVDPVDIIYGRNKHLCNAIKLDNFVERGFCFKILTESNPPPFVFTLL
jgi:hypothetical protein